MKRIVLLILVIIFVNFTAFAQQLVINEVSQGPTGGLGTKEFVELLVVGSPTCNAIPTLDLRGYYIDDNNGTFDNVSFNGLAMGCYRFRNIPFWQNIPYGTIIVIYNAADVNPSISALGTGSVDLSMVDGNCRLVIPCTDCTLLENHTASPNSGSFVYPTTGFGCTGAWQQLGMANTDDSFQTRDASGTLLHAVSWGPTNSSSSSTIVSMGNVPAGGKVFSMSNSTNNNPAVSSNWTNQTVTGNETPGVANTPANAAWINSMNNGCTVIQPFGATTSSVNAGCSCNGSAIITPTGAISPYTYTWAPSGGNAASATNLCAGIYTVTSASSNSCIQTTTINIASVGALTITPATTTVSCFGGTNGSATVTPSGLAGPYVYNWAPAVSVSSVASGLPFGNYTVNVTAGSCSASITINIAQPLTSLNGVISPTDVACFGGASGIASVTASGGTGPYAYSWLPSGGNLALASGLIAGNYSVTITDVNNCTFTTNTLVSQPLTAVNATTSFSNAACGVNNGSATVTANGGVGPYVYNWAPSVSSNSIATGLAVGNYSITVVDANGCSFTTSTSIGQPVTLTLSINSQSITCFSGVNGNASVTANGGVAPYTYTWFPAPGGGQGTNSATGLGVGIYTVNVADVNNCLQILTTSINQPSQISLNVNGITLCSGQTGNLTANTVGGSNPFTFNWNGQTTIVNTLAITPTTTTIYTVTATDANGCVSAIDTALVNTSTPLQLSVASGYSLCAGSSTNITASASGGNGTLNYLWQPGNLSGPSQLVTADGAQIYTVSVTDACPSTKSATTIVIGFSTPVSNAVVSQTTGCAPVCVSFSNNPLVTSGQIQSYNWNFGDNGFSPLPEPNHCYKYKGIYTVILNYTTLYGCVGSQTLSNLINVHPVPVADFICNPIEISSFNTTVSFTNQSTFATGYEWTLDYEAVSTLTNVSHTFVNEKDQFIALIASNEFGCKDTITRILKFTPDFTFFAPNAFTPNQDGTNELFLPKGLGWDVTRYQLEIFDRWGERIFITNEYNKGWDGKVGGVIVKQDTYIWKAYVFDLNSKKHYYIGHTMVLKNTF